MHLFKQHMIFHHCFPHQEHFRQNLLFERHIELTKLYGKRQFDRTIFAIGLKIGTVIGTDYFEQISIAIVNCMNYHDALN